MDKEQSQDEPSAAPKTPVLAIASLTLGICGICTLALTTIVGLALGIAGLKAIKTGAGQLRAHGLVMVGIAVSAISLALIIVGLKAIKRSARQLTGHGLAIVGIGVSTVSFALIVLLVLSIVALSWARDRAMTRESLDYARLLAYCIQMYCDENDGRLPPCDTWPDALTPSAAGILRSPFDPDAGRAWAMNAQLNNRRKYDIRWHHRTVLIFEARFASPPSGGPELLPEKPRARKGYVIVFLDGHAECVPPERIDDLIWSP